MTTLDVSYRYDRIPGSSEMRAIGALTEVYGIRKIRFEESTRTVRLEYDASRLKEDAVTALLRRAGLDIKEKLVLA